jgi:hypothetical protein
MLALFCAAILYSCNSDQPAEKTASLKIASFFQPPLPEADVPYNDYVVDAGKGDTIFAASGSILVFPAQSFLDGKGNPVTGKVNIRFRELPTRSTSTWQASP